MTDIGITERVRTTMQNHTITHDFEWPTPEERAMLREKEAVGYRTMLEKSKGRNWL